MKTASSPKFKTVDEYFASLPAATKDILEEFRKTVKQIVPDAEEVISYNMPSFKWNGMLIWYAAWKNHISLYPYTPELEVAVKEVAHYKEAKGTIKFPLDNPIPFDVITKIVKFRLGLK